MIDTNGWHHSRIKVVHVTQFNRQAEIDKNYHMIWWNGSLHRKTGYVGSVDGRIHLLRHTKREAYYAAKAIYDRLVDKEAANGKNDASASE